MLTRSNVWHSCSDVRRAQWRAMLNRRSFPTCVCQALRYRRASSAACSSLPCLIRTRMRLAGSFSDPAMPLLASCTCTE